MSQRGPVCGWCSVGFVLTQLSCSQTVGCLQDGRRGDLHRPAGVTDVMLWQVVVVAVGSVWQFAPVGRYAVDPVPETVLVSPSQAQCFSAAWLRCLWTSEKNQLTKMKVPDRQTRSFLDLSEPARLIPPHISLCRFWSICADPVIRPAVTGTRISSPAGLHLQRTELSPTGCSVVGRRRGGHIHSLNSSDGGGV